MRLSLTPASRGYKASSTVHFLLHVVDSSAATEDCPAGDSPPVLEDITITFRGIERVDTSWVSKEYRKGVQPLNSDTRRVQRPVVSATLQASTARDFGEEGCRVYLIRMRLPDWVPPTFQGVAVRYNYFMEVAVRWREGSNGRAEEREERVKSVVCVWPCEEMNEMSTATVLDEAALKGLDPSAPQIKCWEVGYGTRIEDAIENVELLRQDSANSVPYSPAYLSNSLSRTASLDYPGSRSSEQPSELLSRRLFQAAQDAMLEEQRQLELRVVTEEEAGVVVMPGGKVPKTPITEASRLLSVSKRLGLSGRPASQSSVGQRYWDGVPGSVSSFRLRFADSVFATVHLHPAKAAVDDAGRDDTKPTRGLVPGMSLIGALEFVNHERVQCVKYVVSLEMEETVMEAWRVKGREHTLNRIVDERTSLAPNTLASCVYFTLPSDATPSFQSEVVTLAWGLRFHFYVRVNDSSVVETVEWKIPLRMTRDE